MDEGRSYAVIHAAYTGALKHYDTAYYYIGELPGSAQPAARNYFEKQFRRLKKRIDGLNAAGIRREEAADLEKVTAALQKEIEKIREG